MRGSKENREGNDSSLGRRSRHMTGNCRAVTLSENSVFHVNGSQQVLLSCDNEGPQEKNKADLPKALSVAREDSNGTYFHTPSSSVEPVKELMSRAARKNSLKFVTDRLIIRFS